MPKSCSSPNFLSWHLRWPIFCRWHLPCCFPGYGDDKEHVRPQDNSGFRSSACRKVQGSPMKTIKGAKEKCCQRGMVVSLWRLIVFSSPIKWVTYERKCNWAHSKAVTLKKNSSASTNFFLFLFKVLLECSWFTMC